MSWVGAKPGSTAELPAADEGGDRERRGERGDAAIGVRAHRSLPWVFAAYATESRGVRFELLERLVLQPPATHGAAIVGLVRCMARAPEHHDQADRGQNDEREHEGDLALNGEHVEKSVSHSLNPLRL